MEFLLLEKIKNLTDSTFKITKNVEVRCIIVNNYIISHRYVIFYLVYKCL